MKSNEAIANFAALSAFDGAVRRKQGREHAKSLASQVWLNHQPCADAQKASAIIEELLADAANCEV